MRFINTSKKYTYHLSYVVEEPNGISFNDIYVKREEPIKSKEHLEQVKDELAGIIGSKSLVIIAFHLLEG